MGVDSAYYALITSPQADNDTAAVIGYDTPVAIDGTIKIGLKNNNSEETLFADNGPYATAQAFSGVEVEIEIAEASLAQIAVFTGATYSGGQLLQSGDDLPPYLALMFRALKADGSYRYVALLKGRLTPVDDTLETKSDKVKFQTVTLKGTFIMRQFVETSGGAAGKSLYKKSSDDGTDWFTVANLVGASISALTVTPTPADGASSVSKATPGIKWTFNNKITSAYVNAGNFSVTEADGTAVAGTLALSSDQREVAFTPTSALDATTTYIMLASSNVKDIYGQQKASNTISDFTTGS